MEMVDEEMSKLHHTVAPIPVIQDRTKERVAMLKEVVITIENMHEWSIKYPRAPTVFPKKDWITTQNAKVQLCVKIQSKQKLGNDVDRVLASYKHMFNGLESTIQIHGVPSIREVGQENKQEDISNEVQTIVHTCK